MKYLFLLLLLFWGYVLNSVDYQKIDFSDILPVNFVSMKSYPCGDSLFVLYQYQQNNETTIALQTFNHLNEPMTKTEVIVKAGLPFHYVPKVSVSQNKLLSITLPDVQGEMTVLNTKQYDILGKEYTTAQTEVIDRKGLTHSFNIRLNDNSILFFKMNKKISGLSPVKADSILACFCNVDSTLLSETFPNQVYKSYNMDYVSEKGDTLWHKEILLNDYRNYVDLISNRSYLIDTQRIQGKLLITFKFGGTLNLMSIHDSGTVESIKTIENNDPYITEYDVKAIKDYLIIRILSADYQKKLLIFDRNLELVNRICFKDQYDNHFGSFDAQLLSDGKLIIFYVLSQFNDKNRDEIRLSHLYYQILDPHQSFDPTLSIRHRRCNSFELTKDHNRFLLHLSDYNGYNADVFDSLGHVVLSDERLNKSPHLYKDIIFFYRNDNVFMTCYSTEQNQLEIKSIDNQTKNVKIRSFSPFSIDRHDVCETKKGYYFVWCEKTSNLMRLKCRFVDKSKVQYPDYQLVSFPVDYYNFKTVNLLNGETMILFSNSLQPYTIQYLLPENGDLDKMKINQIKGITSFSLSSSVIKQIGDDITVYTPSVDGCLFFKFKGSIPQQKESALLKRRDNKSIYRITQMGLIISHQNTNDYFYPFNVQGGLSDSMMCQKSKHLDGIQKTRDGYVFLTYNELSFIKKNTKPFTIKYRLREILAIDDGLYSIQTKNDSVFFVKSVVTNDNLNEIQKTYLNNNPMSLQKICLLNGRIILLFTNNKKLVIQRYTENGLLSSDSITIPEITDSQFGRVDYDIKVLDSTIAVYAKKNGEISYFLIKI